MIQVIAWLGIHIALAQIMHATKSSGINMSTVHALITFAVCLFMAVNRRHPEKAIYALAYIAASEVLWRMTKSRLIWELGKYALSLVALVSIMNKGPKRMGMPFLFLMCLLPSILILPFDIKGWDVLRSEISFNLSGPLSLALCVVCCAKIRLTTEQLQKMFIVFLGPVTGIFSIAAMGAYSAREMFKLETESSAIGSGGFGPNQVSAILGLGAVYAFFYILENRNKKFIRVIMFFLGLALATQSALTFSRGGLYCAAGAAFLIIINMVQNKKIRNRIIGSFIVIMLAANFIALPALVKFTGGSIVERFKDTSATGRESIFQDDINVFLKNPILGVGPGEAKFSREKYGQDIASHSEVSRLLAEHGIFGLASLILLMLMGFLAHRKSKHPTAKALVSSMVIWTLLNMLTAAMRTALGSFAFGLAFIQYIPALPPPIIKPQKEGVGDDLLVRSTARGIDTSK